MDKIEIKIQPIEDTTFMFNSFNIIVKPYLSMAEKTILQNEYLHLLFDENNAGISNRYFLAEHALIMQIVDIVSNINVDDLNVDMVINSGLWDEIKKRIKDYDSFRYDLNRLVLLYQYEKNLDISLGAVLERIAGKISELAGNFSDTDLKELKETSTTFVNALNELNDTIPGIIKDRPAKRARAKGV